MKGNHNLTADTFSNSEVVINMSKIQNERKSQHTYSLNDSYKRCN